MKPHLCVAVLLLFPAAAFAQGNPGPFGGLFGRTPNRTGVDYRVFEIRGFGSSQWNDVVSEPQRPDPVFSGPVGSAAVAATYDRRSDRLNVRADSQVDFRRSLTSLGTTGTTSDVGVMVSGRPTTRLSAEISAKYRHSPYFQFYPSFVWLGDGLSAPGLPYEVTTSGYHLGEARVGGAFQYSKSSTVSAHASRAETQFPLSPQDNVSMSGYEGLWSRRLNRNFVLRLGYGRQEVRHRTVVGDFMEEQIEAGVDFHRALTMSPRTTVGFTTHTSILRQSHHDAVYRLNGDFLLTRRFHRTWTLQFNANRATDFLAGSVDPLFVDSVALSASGLLAVRAEFVAMVRGSRGRFGYERDLGRFSMAATMAQLNFAVTRHVGLYGQYAFYHHNAPPDAFTVPTLGQMSRQTFTVGITTWLPIYVRERTPLDPR